MKAFFAAVMCGQAVPTVLVAVMIGLEVPTMQCSGDRGPKELQVKDGKVFLELLPSEKVKCFENVFFARKVGTLCKGKDGVAYFSSSTKNVEPTNDHHIKEFPKTAFAELVTRYWKFIPHHTSQLKTSLELTTVERTEYNGKKEKHDIDGVHLPPSTCESAVGDWEAQNKFEQLQKLYREQRDIKEDQQLDRENKIVQREKDKWCAQLFCCSFSQWFSKFFAAKDDSSNKKK
jgi:hypothetical protein